MIGDAIAIFGIPAAITGILWLFQKLSNTLGPRATYRRRRMFGFLVLFMLFISIIGAISLMSDPETVKIASRALARSAVRFFFIGGAIFWSGIINEDGFLRSIVIPYAALTPQARERLVTGETIQD